MYLISACMFSLGAGGSQDRHPVSALSAASKWAAGSAGPNRKPSGAGMAGGLRGTTAMKPEDSDQEAIRVRLTEWLKSKLPSADDLTLSSLTKPGLGFSNETLLGELSWQEGDHGRQESLGFRLEPRQFRVFPEYDLAKQVRVMQGLSKTPVPVPDVLWLEEDPSVLGCPFYVMRKIDGEIPQDVPPHHASRP